ncbi:phage tail tube protein [Streptomyces iakyrus]|uniref:phage tail tube protein n=1 Tax=Streptomyces iakyrus TaxID=68219 RepID=UPI0036E7D5A2
MATGSPFIGRKEGIGLGIEATPGTAVAPQVFLRWLDQGLNNMTEVAENDSAMGVVEKVNDSAIVAKWAEGTIEGKVTVESVGFLLLGMFGTVSTGSATSGVYPHTFSVNQSSVPTALTIAHVTPLKTQRYAYGVLDNFELSAEAGAYVTVSCAVRARVGATSADTVVIQEAETEFTSKHVTVKKAANLAGLSGAAALSARSVQLTLERSSEKHDPLGADEDPEFDRGEFEARGEFVVRYTDTAYEDAFLANTISAMEIKLANGTDTLAFTASKVRYRELEKSTDKAGVVTQTVAFYCEFDETEGKAIEAVLNNERATYEAA